MRELFSLIYEATVLIGTVLLVGVGLVVSRTLRFARTWQGSAVLAGAAAGQALTGVTW